MVVDIVKVDHLIVGQGLAGSLLAWHLMQKGRRVMVIDRDEAVTSSKVAAGLVTPISGQQFSLAADIKESLMVAKRTFWEIEELADRSLFHHIRIARLFGSSEEQLKWQKRLANDESKARYEDFHCPLEWDPELYHGEHGGIEIKRGGWLDVPAFLDVMRQLLLERIGLAIGKVDSRELEFPNGTNQLGVKWKNLTADSIIFCQGWQGSNNHLFKSIAMNNARGDILRIECATAANEQRILNRNGWILPVGDGLFRAGSTYDHDFGEDESPSEAGREKVEAKIRGILKPKFQVIGHDSAVRPIISRSNVYMGPHPQFPSVYYFNGLGSKGVTNAPAWTRALAEHLVEGKPIEADRDIREQFDF